MGVPTASQTIGPYWHLIEDQAWADLTRFDAQGETIVLTGRVLDGDGEPCRDTCVEIWQSDPPSSAHFPGFGRSHTDAMGLYRFVTVRPRPVAGRGSTQQAPHIALLVMSRGLMRGLLTRAYFQDEPWNSNDPLLTSLDPGRRATLIAVPELHSVWRLDIHLQGAQETVFFDV